MLNNCIPGKEVLITIILIVFIGSAPVTRAEDDFEAMAGMVGLMDSFLGLMNSIYDMNADNEKAVLLQMHAIEEIYKNQGKHGEAVAVYQKVLEESKNSTVRNIAYHRMADVLKESGDQEGAIKVLNRALTETLKRTK